MLFQFETHYLLFYGFALDAFTDDQQARVLHTLTRLCKCREQELMIFFRIEPRNDCHDALSCAESERSASITLGFIESLEVYSGADDGQFPFRNSNPLAHETLALIADGYNLPAKKGEKPESNAHLSPAFVNFKRVFRVNDARARQFRADEAVEELVEVVRLNNTGSRPCEQSVEPPDETQVNSLTAIHH